MREEAAVRTLNDSYWTRGLRPLSRRHALGAAAAGLAVACGSRGSKNSPGGSGDSTDQSAAIIGKSWNVSAGAPKYGGTLQHSCTVPALANLDPILSTSLMVQNCVSNTYSKLVRITHKPGDQNAQVIYPDLATSWEVASPTTWTFHIRPGVKFHDVPPTNGRDLTSDDVKYSILRSATDKSSQFRGGFINLDSVETPDKQTVVLKLKRHDALLFSNLAGWYVWVVPHELADGPGLKNAMVGSGPFIFERWDQDAAISYRKNPSYYQKGIPFADSLKQLQITSTDDRLAAMRSGQIVSQISLEPGNYAKLKSSAPNLMTQRYLVVAPNALFMNYKEPLFQDDRVRKAIDLAIDMDAITKINNNGEGLWRGVLSAQNAGWALTQEELKSKDYYLRYDVAEAKQLMSAAGHAEGFQTDLLYNSSSRQELVNVSQYLQQALAAINIKVNLVGQEQTTFRRNQDTHNYKGLCQGSDGEAFPEAFLLDYRSDGPKNGSGAALLWLDDGIDKVLETPDENDRKAKAKDLTRQILKQVVWKIELGDIYQYEAWQPWAKNWFSPPPQVYETSGLAFAWIDK